MADTDDPWLPIGAASRLVGVGPDTLRRWADAGKVQSYQTAGGHRRFLRSSLEAITSSSRRPRYETGRLADSAGTIVGDVQRRMQRTGYAGMPWQSRLTAEQRADFRRWGQRTFNLVIEYVAATKRRERDLLLAEAERMGALYGHEASAANLTLAEAVEAFLFYRSPVVEAILAHLRRRVADVAQVTTAVREANAAVDQVLVALVSSYRDRTGPERRAGRSGVEPGDPATTGEAGGGAEPNAHPEPQAGHEQRTGSRQGRGRPRKRSAARDRSG